MTRRAVRVPPGRTVTSMDLGMHPQSDGGPTCCIGSCRKRATMCATFGKRGRANLCDRHFQEFRGSGMWGHAMTDFQEI